MLPERMVRRHIAVGEIMISFWLPTVRSLIKISKKPFNINKCHQILATKCIWIYVSPGHQMEQTESRRDSISHWGSVLRSINQLSFVTYLCQYISPNFAMQVPFVNINTHVCKGRRPQIKNQDRKSSNKSNIQRNTGVWNELDNVQLCETQVLSCKGWQYEKV